MKARKISKNFKMLIATNLIVVIFLYADWLLPSNKIYFEKISKLENSVKSVASGKYGNRSALEDVHFLYCKSQNIYRLFELTECENQILENKQIKVKKTILLSKIKNVELTEKSMCSELSSGFLEHNYVLISFCVAALVSVLFQFFSNAILDVSLALSTAYIYFATVIYLFYIE